MIDNTARKKIKQLENRVSSLEEAIIKLKFGRDPREISPYKAQALKILKSLSSKRPFLG